MAFMNSDTFNRKGESPDWPLFMTVEETRAQFAPGTKIMVAIGGWGDTVGFALGATTQESRQNWAQNVAIMIRDTGADGEYERRYLSGVSKPLWSNPLIGLHCHRGRY